jgi:hypothetical protein
LKDTWRAPCLSTVCRPPHWSPLGRSHPSLPRVTVPLPLPPPWPPWW